MSDGRSIAELVESAGGAEKIVSEANRRDLKLTKWGPYKWPTAGIPEKYWEILKDLADADANEIYAANVRARQEADDKAAA